MIRVILEHKAKDPEKLIDIIREVRNEAMKQRGYITGETLVNTNDPKNVLVISTWDKLEDWETWDNSEVRRKLKAKINGFVTEPYTVRSFHYHLMPYPLHDSE